MDDNTINSDLIRGHIDTIILKSLYEGDRYGYDIIKEIEAKTGGEYKLKQPTLYSCLKRLEEQGFTRSYWGVKAMGGRKKYYTLTDMGRELFIKNQNSWQRSRGIIDKLINDGDFDFSLSLDDRSDAVHSVNSSSNSSISTSLSSSASSSNSTTTSATTENHYYSSTQTIINNNSVSSNSSENIESVFISDEALSKEYMLTGVENGYESNNQTAAYAPDSPFYKMEFSSSTYELEPHTNEMREINASSASSQRTESVSTSASQYFDSTKLDTSTLSGGPIESAPTDGEMSGKDYKTVAAQSEIISSGGGSGGTTDYGFASYDALEKNSKAQEFLYSDEVYFGQKDKPSYVDDVSTAVYTPRPKKNVVEDTYIYDDELPYEQHMREQYGEFMDEVVETTTTTTVITETTSSESTYQDVRELEPPTMAQKEQGGFDVHELDSPTAKTVSENDEYSQFIKYNSPISSLSDQQIVDRDYQSALTKLIREQKPRYSDNPHQQQKLEKTAEAAKEMGDSVVIRTHKDTVKEFNSENYYYSGRLKLWQYFIVFFIMLAQTAICFFIFEVAIHERVITELDLWIYVGGVILALTLPMIAFFMSVINYNRRKKNEFEYFSTFLYRLLVLGLLWVIIVAANGYNGLFSGRIPFTDYLATLVYPMILATNVIVGLVAFNGLLKSKRFNC